MRKRRHKVWSGRFIILWSDGHAEFFRCIYCKRFLEAPEARSAGAGLDCLAQRTVGAHMANAAAVRRLERERYRAEISSGDGDPAQEPDDSS